MPTHRIAALGIGYVPQSSNVFSTLTVQENLEMSATLLPASQQPARSRKPMHAFRA